MRKLIAAVIAVTVLFSAGAFADVLGEGALGIQTALSKAKLDVGRHGVANSLPVGKADDSVRVDVFCALDVAQVILGHGVFLPIS